MPDRLPKGVAVALIALTLALAAVFAVCLARDPFSDLPDDPDVTVNLAGFFPAEGEEPLEKPLGIAMDGNRVFVADADAGVVRIFDRYGRDRGRIVLPATDGVQSRPTALAIAGSGHIAVVDSGSERVLIVAARKAEEAEVLFTLGSEEDGTAASRPVAVAYAEDEFFVAETGGAPIRVYDSDGVLVRKIGDASGSVIEYPGGVLVDNGAVYVSDTRAGRVVAFDAESGDLIAEWPDAYSVPRGLAAVEDGVAVADVLGQAAFVCDTDGFRTHTLNAETVSDMPLVLPESVAWDPLRSRLYVTDSATGMVVVFNVRLP